MLLPPIIAFRRLFDNAENLAPNQAAEPADEKPVKPKTPAARRVRAENARFCVETNDAVRRLGERKIPRRFRVTRFVEANKIIGFDANEIAVRLPEFAGQTEFDTRCRRVCGDNR